MPTEIGTQLAAAVEHLHAAPDLAARVMRRSRLRRKRQVITGALTAVMAIAVAIAIPLAATDSSSGVSRLVPVSTPSVPPPSPLASVDGVDVTWVPEGFSFKGFTDSGTSKDDHAPYIAGYFVTAREALGDPEISLVVQRGYAADLSVFATEPGQRARSVTVQGQQGILQTWGPDAGSKPGDYQLTWVDPARVTVTLDSGGGISLDQIERMAAGLRIHATLSQPGNLAAATKAVRLAAQHAFNGNEPTSPILGAIVNGKQLAPALAELARKSPDLRNLTRVTVTSIRFEDAAHALVGLDIVTDQAGVTQSLAWTVTVELSQGHWKVNQASYCNVIGPIVTACPPA